MKEAFGKVWYCCVEKDCLSDISHEMTPYIALVCYVRKISWEIR